MVRLILLILIEFTQLLTNKIQDGKIIKHDKIASIPDNCTLYNDAVTDKTNLIDIDYDWYIRAAKKNAVEMKRLI